MMAENRRRDSNSSIAKAIRGFKVVKCLRAVRGFCSVPTSRANKGNTIAVGLLMQARMQQARAANDLPPRHAARPSRVKNAHNSSLRDAIHATASVRCGCSAQKRVRSNEPCNRKCLYGVLSLPCACDILQASLKSSRTLAR